MYEEKTPKTKRKKGYWISFTQNTETGINYLKHTQLYDQTQGHVIGYLQVKIDYYSMHQFWIRWRFKLRKFKIFVGRMQGTERKSAKSKWISGKERRTELNRRKITSLFCMCGQLERRWKPWKQNHRNVKKRRGEREKVSWAFKKNNQTKQKWINK